MRKRRWRLYMFVVSAMVAACSQSGEKPPESTSNAPAAQPPVAQSLQMGGAKSVMTFFVTSRGSGKGGDLGGLSGADAHCQALAKAGKLPEAQAAFNG